MDELSVESSIAILSFFTFGLGVIVGVIIAKFAAMIHHKSEASSGK
jgi:hypothetical protein